MLRSDSIENSDPATVPNQASNPDLADDETSTSSSDFSIVQNLSPGHFTIYEPAGRSIFKLSHWEHLAAQTKANPLPEIKTEAKTISNQLSTAFHSVMTFFFHENPDPRTSPNYDLLANTLENFGFDDFIQGRNVFILGKQLLLQYCKKDSPQNPSVLFDAIIAGTMILTMAIEDQKCGQPKSKYQNQRLYPLSLETLCKLCNMDDKYSWARPYQFINSIWGEIPIKEFILMIGCKALIEKTIPFDGKIRADFYPQLANVIPLNRFQRYNLQPVNPALAEPFPDGMRARVFSIFEQEQPISGCVYGIKDIKQAIALGIKEDDFFDFECDFEEKYPHLKELFAEPEPAPNSSPRLR